MDSAVHKALSDEFNSDLSEEENISAIESKLESNVAFKNMFFKKVQELYSSYSGIEVYQ